MFVRGDLGVLGEEIGVHAGEEGALLVGLDVDLALVVNVSEDQVGKEKTGDRWGAWEIYRKRSLDISLPDFSVEIVGLGQTRGSPRSVDDCVELAFGFGRL